MENFKKYLPWGIRITVAILFLVSGYAKIYPSPNFALGTFEAKQLLPMGFSEGFAPYFSRFLLAAEFSIGFALLQPHFLRRFVVPVATLLLAIFCIQLGYEIAVNGNEGNCGCFGQLIPMTPLQAIIKNVIAIGMLAYLYKVMDKDAKETNRFAYPLLIFTTTAWLMYAIAPIQFPPEQPTEVTGEDGGLDDFIDQDDAEDQIHPSDTTLKHDNKDQNENPDKGNGKGDNQTEDPPRPKGPAKVKSKFSEYPLYVPPAIKIDEGKKILCLFAPGCEHCRATAKTLTAMRAKDPNFPPVHIIFIDEDLESIPDFFDFAGRTYSYRVADVGDFWRILDFSRDTPGVVYLWNGNVRYFADGINDNEFTEAGLRKALDKEE